MTKLWDPLPKSNGTKETWFYVGRIYQPLSGIPTHILAGALIRPVVIRDSLRSYIAKEPFQLDPSSNWEIPKNSKMYHTDRQVEPFTVFFQYEEIIEADGEQFVGFVVSPQYIGFCVADNNLLIPTSKLKNGP